MYWSTRDLLQIPRQKFRDRNVGAFHEFYLLLIPSCTEIEDHRKLEYKFMAPAVA
jgi:hypothetical protein